MEDMYVYYDRRVCMIDDEQNERGFCDVGYRDLGVYGVEDEGFARDQAVGSLSSRMIALSLCHAR